MNLLGVNVKKYRYKYLSIIFEVSRPWGLHRDNLEYKLFPL